jgi:hypothetical protein
MITTHTRAKNEVGGAFVQRHQADVIGVLHGWDRLRLQGDAAQPVLPAGDGRVPLAERSVVEGF